MCQWTCTHRETATDTQINYTHNLAICFQSKLVCPIHKYHYYNLMPKIGQNASLATLVTEKSQLRLQKPLVKMTFTEGGLSFICVNNDFPAYFC